MVIEAVRPPSFGTDDRKAPGQSESRWGIRKRSVLSAVVVVTLSMLVGGAFLLLVLQSSLISAARSNLAVRASDVADSIRPALQHIAPEQLIVSSDCGFGRQDRSEP